MASGARVPQRTCVACRARRDKPQLVRIVRQPDGHVSFDPSGRLEGRGAYLCADAACWRAARKRGALQRALRVTLPSALDQRLEHGDVAGVHAATGHGAPGMMGGTDGT